NAIDTRRAGGLWSWQGGNGPSQGEAIMPVLDSMGTSGITQISSGGVPSNFMSRNNWSWTTSAGIAYNYFWGSEIGIGIGSLMPYHIYGLELPVRGSGLAGNHNIGYTWVGWPGKTLESGVGTYIGTSLIAVVDGDMGSGVNAYARTMDNVDITPFIDRGEFVSRTDTNSATPWSFVVDGMDYAEPRYEYEYSDMDYRGVPADLLVLPNGNELADWARKPAWETWGYGDTLEPRALFYLVPILARLGYGSVTYDAGWYDRGGTTPAGSDPIYMPRWDGSTSTSANCNWDLVAPLLEAYFAQHPHPKHTTPGDAYDFTNLDRTTQSGAIRIVRAMNEYVHDHGMHVLAWIQTTYVAAGPYGAGVVPAEWAVLNPNGSRNGNYGCCGNPDFINVATTYISEIIFGDGKGEYAFDGFKGDSIGGIPPCYATGHGHDGDPYAPMRNYGLFYKNLLDKAAYIRGATEYVGGPIVNANQMPAMKHCMCGRRMDYYSFTGVNRPIWGDHGGTKQNRQGNRIWRGFFGWDVPMDSDHHELDSRDDGTRAVLESIGDFDYATALGTGMLFTGKTRINLNEYNDKVEERSSLMTFPGSENYNKRTGFLEAIDDDYDGPSPWGDGAIKWGRAVKYYGLYHDIKVVQSRMFDNLYKYAVDYPEAYAFELMDRNPITGVLTPKASSERVYSFYATSFPIDATDPRVRNDPPAGSGFDAASGSKYYREVANSGSNPRTWDPWNSIDKGIPNTTAWIEPNIPFTMTYRGDIELRGLDPNSRYYLTDIETGAKLTKDSDADGNIIFNTTFINSVIYHVAKAQKASITGRVYNQEGELLPGATLTMYNAAGQRMFADTASDLDGFYSFPLVPAGSYKITVTFPREYVEPEEGATEPVNLDYFTNVYSITENASVVAQALVKDIIIDLSTVIDRTEMGAAIASAKQELANTAVSSNGLDVSYTVRWVTQAAADALAAAIAAAEDATIDSQEAADSVAAVLKAAIAIFNNAKRFGTKDRLTGGGGTSVVPITAATPTPSPAPALDAEGEPGDGEGEGEGDGDSAASGATPTPAPAPVRTSKMVDITSAYWAFDFIDGLVALGIVDGYPLDNGTFEFRPEDTITRAEMIKLIVASLDLELIYDYDGSEFADWDAVADWAKPYVAAAVEEGIVLGSTLEDGIYILADDNIIRQEMIAMFVRALGIDIAEGAESDLADFDEIDDWAKDYVVFVADEGMINIDAAGNTRPKDDATRAEAAMVLFYLLDYLEL
ncbi:MAG: S-layer homology domain-containing protein, partial [Oscillospiraceae bacterium]|nr:S-layer homology domain-containing protein [Oscillospiraceae bacterium]